jgi:hypothetical protein
MNQQLRESRWPCLAILACLFVTYAVMPRVWEQNAHSLDNTLQHAVDIVPKIDNANYQIDVFPPTDESIRSYSHIDTHFQGGVDFCDKGEDVSAKGDGSIFAGTKIGTVPQSQAVVAEPSAAILSEISDTAILDDKATDSLSSNSATSEIASPGKENSSQEEVAGTSPVVPEPSTKPSSAPEQSPAIVEQTPSVKKEAPTLVAHLPMATNLPVETAKPGPIELHYPTTGLEPFKPLAPPNDEQSKSARNELSSWTEPSSLLSLLDDLAKAEESSVWAAETAKMVRELGPAIAGNSDEAADILDRLGKSHVEAARLADATTDWPLARKLRQASYAIERRLEVWREVAWLGASSLIEADKPKIDSQRLSMCLAEMNRLMNTSAEGQQWRKYLLVDSLQELSSQRFISDTETEQQRKVAQKVLARMTQTPMSIRQRQFIASAPMAAFCAELRHWAADPLTSADVLRDMERYEQTRLPSDAKRLADDLRSLAQSSDSERHELARSVESHYRNANIRVSLTENLINRLIPEQNIELAPVRDTVMGLPVRGQSLTSTDVALRLIPDPTRVRMALEVTGEVAAMTSSTSGPATFINDSESLYAARKPFEIDQKGIKLSPSKVDVRHETQLRDVATNFDGIPLLGLFARSVARTQHEAFKPWANEEARGKVADKARQRIDTEAHDRLAEMVDNLNRKVFGPLVNLALEPTMIEAQTTEQRLTTRLRVAGEDQLGSYTPRPQAPENSLASFQINESMLNNALQRLELEGRTFTLPQLIERISERFQRPNIWPMNPDYEDLTVSFAKKDAVAMRCQDGRVILTLNITEISKEPRQWNNFQVIVFYRPQVDGRSAELVRDGVVQLIGRRLNNKEQIALRGIFSNAFPKNGTIKLTPDRLVIDPKLQDLAITQFVIDDGWIGFAVGPKQYAVQTTRLPSNRK